MSKKGLLLVVSGPSGAGKGTICQAFLQRHPEMNASVSATTRQPRQGEVDGVNYYFLSEREFKRRIENDELYEYANNYGNYYGTPKHFIQEKIAAGEDVILEIDIKGALQVKKKLDDAVYIFILPPSMAELKNRIIKRGSESDESLNRRYLSAFREIDYVNEYDYYIINNDIEVATNIMASIVTAEKQRVTRGLQNKLSVLKHVLKED